MHNAADSKNCKKKENNTSAGRERVCVGCFVAHFRAGLVFSLGARTYFLFETERPGFKETSKKLCFSAAQTPRCEKLAESPARTVSKVGE